ncbi:MAG: MraY family glycosyltransferase, partial [Gemmatimonadaceae bacterium]
MEFLPLVVALIASTALTPIVRAIAIRAGMVAQPKTDRWHKRPTALLGGVSIALSVALTWIVFRDQMPGDRQAWVVLGGSLFLGAVGFVDDILHIKPYQKLIGQLMASALVISAGLTLPWTSSQEFNVAITFFWLVGITNAINLLDNMDGLAAGVSATAAAFLAINLALNGQPQQAIMLGLLAAALIGFLFYNSNPASVFMGDTGSMFIGFFLASAALLSATGARSRSFVVVLAAPVLVLLIPIFDTTLVTVMRKLAGRPASQGGRDHTSHRLVALGLSESRAVWLLYGLAVVS